MIKILIHLLLAACLFSPALSADELKALSPTQLLDLQQQQKALVVDVRTATEWQASGIIKDSHKLQSFDADGHFEAEKWRSALEKLKSSPDQPVILVCRSGNRSSKVGEWMTKEWGMKNVYHLQNGLQAWLKQGYPVVENCLQLSCR